MSCVCEEDSEVGVSGDYLHVHIVYRARISVCPRPYNLTTRLCRSVSLAVIVRACTKCTCVLHHEVTEKQREVNEEKRRQSESDVNTRKKRKEMKTFTLDLTLMFTYKTSNKTVRSGLWLGSQLSSVIFVLF